MVDFLTFSEIVSAGLLLDLRVSLVTSPYEALPTLSRRIIPSPPFNPSSSSQAIHPCACSFRFLMVKSEQVLIQPALTHIFPTQAHLNCKPLLLTIRSLSGPRQVYSHPPSSTIFQDLQTTLAVLPSVLLYFCTYRPNSRSDSLHLLPQSLSIILGNFMTCPTLSPSTYTVRNSLYPFIGVLIVVFGR